MPWQALVIELDEALTEAFSEALVDAGAQSVSIEDAEAGDAAEDPRYGEPGASARVWRRNRVTALIGTDADPAALVAGAARGAGLAKTPGYRLERLEDADWVRSTQSQHAPLRVADRLWIVPTWCEPPEPAATNVRIDPGLAFGTGSHASTRLVLRWLARAVPQLGAVRVLDYGCGSGILAIAAARLGAAEVTAVDVDPLALEATSANARLNGVALHVAAPDDLPPGEYDLVVANILANPLVVLAPLLIAHTVPNGRIVLSGVLSAQAREVIAAYAPGAPLSVTDEEDGWALLSGARAAGERR